jgi:hypothetical protein
MGLLGYYTVKMKGQRIVLRPIRGKKLLKLDETLNTVAYVAYRKGCNGAKLGSVEFRVRWFQVDCQGNITVDRSMTAANLRIVGVIYMDIPQSFNMIIL